MSSDNTSFPDPIAPPALQPAGYEAYGWLTPPPPPRAKFQHRYTIHIVLFVVTLVTTTWAGALSYGGFLESVGVPGLGRITVVDLLMKGFWYSLPLLAILSAHEFGHYIYCRRHNVDATLPYFIPGPAPFLLTGTFGAVIRIREPFPSKRALFDIGVAGPIGGFLALVPLLYWGVTLSQVTRLPQDASGLIYFGEPLLFKAMTWLHFGHIPDGYDIVLHPLGFAAWFGMLATALNLLPFGQLDGGHIVYSIFGRRASYVSLATLAVTALLTIRSLSWISMTLMMLAMAVFLGVRHPHVVDEGTPLDGRRQLVALCALIIFILCFTPVPIQTLLK